MHDATPYLSRSLDAFTCCLLGRAHTTLLLPPLLLHDTLHGSARTRCTFHVHLSPRYRFHSPLHHRFSSRPPSCHVSDPFPRTDIFPLSLCVSFLSIFYPSVFLFLGLCHKAFRGTRRPIHMQRADLAADEHERGVYRRFCLGFVILPWIESSGTALLWKEGEA